MPLIVAPMQHDRSQEILLILGAGRRLNGQVDYIRVRLKAVKDRPDVLI
jgi:hypothetical protein